MPLSAYHAHLSNHTHTALPVGLHVWRVGPLFPCPLHHQWDAGVTPLLLRLHVLVMEFIGKTCGDICLFNAYQHFPINMVSYHDLIIVQNIRLVAEHPTEQYFHRYYHLV